MQRWQWVGAAILVLLLAGMGYEQIGRRHDRARYRQIGRSVDIGGRTLNLYCSGEGTPAVIFETFGHTAGYSWSTVQPQVAAFTRACWYDRANYGWSDPGPIPVTYQSTASDLHQLLRAADVPPPYVMTGAGEAALEIRVFHGMYPLEVAGVVMVNALDLDDPTHEVPDFAKGPWAKHFGKWAPGFRGAACQAYPAASALGVVRLFWEFQGSRATPAYGLPVDHRAELDFLSDNPTAERGGGVCGREKSMEQVRAAGDLGDVPLIVLASRERFPVPAGADARAVAEFDADFIGRVQPALARLSRRGRLEVLEERPDPAVIAGAAQTVVEESRALLRPNAEHQ